MDLKARMTENQTGRAVGHQDRVVMSDAGR
jgi:hypothetical protein